MRNKLIVIMLRGKLSWRISGVFDQRYFLVCVCVCVCVRERERERCYQRGGLGFSIQIFMNISRGVNSEKNVIKP